MKLNAVGPDEYVVFELQQIARLWAEFADVTIAIRSAAGVMGKKSGHFYGRRSGRECCGLRDRCRGRCLGARVVC